MELNPTQQRTLELLRRSGEPVVFDPALAEDLRETMSSALAELGERLGGDTLFVTKHVLAGVHGCEASFLNPEPFAWSPATAHGQVAHRAIQLLLNWRGEPTARDLVDESIARLADEDYGIGQWIGGLSPGDEAELRGSAVDRVTKFVECFPPLDWRAHPQVESPTQFPVDGPILLRARADLVLGKLAGNESRKVIIDLKTGRAVHRHREDLRFYALVETLARRVPPRKLASYYLDAGEPIVEDVTEGLLRAALQRTLDGIHRIIQLRREKREPTRQAGPACRWCSLQSSCEVGQAFLRGDEDEIDLR